MATLFYECTVVSDRTYDDMDGRESRDHIRNFISRYICMHMQNLASFLILSDRSLCMFMIASNAVYIGQVL